MLLSQRVNLLLNQCTSPYRSVLNIKPAYYYHLGNTSCIILSMVVMKYFISTYIFKLLLLIIHKNDNSFADRIGLTLHLCVCSSIHVHYGVCMCRQTDSFRHWLQSKKVKQTPLSTAANLKLSCLPPTSPEQHWSYSSTVWLYMGPGI